MATFRVEELTRAFAGEPRARAEALASLLRDSGASVEVSSELVERLNELEARVESARPAPTAEELALSLLTLLATFGRSETPP